MLSVNHEGVIKNNPFPLAKDSDIWKDIKRGWTKHEGVWKELWNYEEVLITSSGNWIVPDGIDTISVALVPGNSNSNFNNSLYAGPANSVTLSGSSATISPGITNVTFSGQGGSGSSSQIPLGSNAISNYTYPIDGDSSELKLPDGSYFGVRGTITGTIPYGSQPSSATFTISFPQYTATYGSWSYVSIPSSTNVILSLYNVGNGNIYYGTISSPKSFFYNIYLGGVLYAANLDATVLAATTLINSWTINYQTSYTTGASTTLNVPSVNSYNFAGGYGGAASVQNQSVILPGTGSNITYSIASGGSLSYSYSLFKSGQDGFIVGSNFDLNNTGISVGGSYTGGIAVWKNNITVTPGQSIPITLGADGGVLIRLGINREFS